MFIIGVDLGQTNDYTAIIVIEPAGACLLQVRLLERMRAPYPQVVERLQSINRNLPSRAGNAMIVDITGVGLPVYDFLFKAGLRPIGCLIHGGDRATFDEDRKKPIARVPKRDLVSTVQILLENRRLKIADLPLREVLLAELSHFKVKIDPQTSHDSYSAWRERDHDDLVLALALACWWSERPKKPPTPRIVWHQNLDPTPPRRRVSMLKDPSSL